MIKLLRGESVCVLFVSETQEFLAWNNKTIFEYNRSYTVKTVNLTEHFSPQHFPLFRITFLFVQYAVCSFGKVHNSVFCADRNL